MFACQIGVTPIDLLVLLFSSGVAAKTGLALWVFYFKWGGKADTLKAGEREPADGCKPGELAPRASDDNTFNLHRNPLLFSSMPPI